MQISKLISGRLKKNAAYKNIFLTPEGHLKAEAEIVLADLARFARFFSDWGPDPQALAMVEGRRQIVRRLWKMLKLNEKELFKQMDDE